MKRRRVLLLGRPSIFTDAVQKILEKAECVELVGIAALEVGKIEEINRLHPEVMVLAGEDDAPPRIEMVLARLLKACPDVPVIVTTTAENVLYIYTSRRSIARTPDLIAAITASPEWRQMDSTD